MKQRAKILDRVARGTDLITESLIMQPLVELAGERRVLIENHNGVTQYNTCEICVKVKYGEVCVHGAELELARMTSEQLVITGRIDSVQLCRRKA